MLPISLRRIQIYSIQHSSLCCAILRTDLFLNFYPSRDLVWQRRDVARTTKSLFKLKPLLDLYVTLHLSFLQAILCLQCMMNIIVWILARRILRLSPPKSISIFASLERTKLWTISCIRPNDSGSPNSFDKRRVKSQIRSLLLPGLTARKTTEYVAIMNCWSFVNVTFLRREDCSMC
jgi:hypothetical protein